MLWWARCGISLEGQGLGAGGPNRPEGFAPLLRCAALLDRGLHCGLELALDLLHRRGVGVAQAAGAMGESPVIIVKKSDPAGLHPYS